MKEEILKRGMFATPLSSKSKNTGIMQGFEDMEDTSVEEMPPMARVPQNPEILMNNLRGDIRSVDARYMELAQMVGEQAAMDTPPEVLAMLQMQMAQPPVPPAPAGPPQSPQMDMQGGIGALPQAAGMMPPGMEGAPPFPAGAEGAPPTPDGLPPERAALGKFITAAGRYGSDIAQGARAMGSNALEAGSDAIRAADRFLGDTFARPYMDIAPMVQDGRRMVGQGADDLRMSQPNMLTPMSPVPGEGSRLRGLNTMDLRNPTMSQAIEASGRMNPKSFIGGTALATGPYSAQLASDMADRMSRTSDQSAQSQADQIPGQGPPLVDAMGKPIRQGEAFLPANETINKVMREPSPIATTPFIPPVEKKPEETVIQEKPTTGEDLTNKFIKEKLAEPKTKSQRIKEEYEGLAPMFTELLGGDKENMRMNALLLLSDAGFKLASTYRPTMAMALGESLSGLPRGMAALAAQARQNGIQLKTAALQQATNNIQLQDKYALDLQLANTKGAWKLKDTMLAKDYDLQKTIAQEGGTVLDDSGMGLRTQKTKKGSFVGNYIDPNDPTVTSALKSSFTLRPTDNPFVEWRGQAPTTVETDKTERVKLGGTLRSLDNSLQTLQNLKGSYAGAYSPGTWFTDKVNNIFVPISGGLIRPDVNQQDTATRISTGMNQIMKSIASANDSGRVAVQEQEWARETAKGINDPTAFFANKELAAKQFNSMESMLRNARQNVLTQLGYVDQDYVMNTPSTGTQSDPFVISADPAEQKRMFTYLGSTIGMVQDPNATVYIRMPNGRVDAFNPTQLKSLVQK